MAKISFVLNFKNGEVSISADKKVETVAGSDKWTMEKNKGGNLNSSSGKLEVSVQSSKISAKSNIDIKSNAKVNVAGTGGTNVTSSGQTVVKGSILNLN